MTIITQHCTTIGGIMTKDVGAITYDVLLKSERINNETLQIMAAYAETDEWYEVGSVKAPFIKKETENILHNLIAAYLLTDRGKDKHDNPKVNVIKGVEEILQPLYQ